MRSEQSFSFVARDKDWNRHDIEVSGKNVDHAATKALATYPKYWRIESKQGSPIKIRPGVHYDYPAGGAMKAALERAKAEQDGKETVAPALPPPPEFPPQAGRSQSTMSKIRTIIIPLLHTLPTPFGRVDVENLLHAHGGAEYITKASVNNVLNAWCAMPKPTHIVRYQDASGKAVDGKYVVLPELRAICLRAELAARRTSEPQPAPLPDVRSTNSARNSVYAQTHPALHAAPSATNGHAAPNGHTNGHTPNGHAVGGIATADDKTHITVGPSATSPEAITKPAPSEPARTRATDVLKVTSKVDLLALFCSEAIGTSSEEDAKLLEEGYLKMMEGLEQVQTVAKRLRSVIGIRSKIGELLQSDVA